MKTIPYIVLLAVVSGCSSGLQERAFMDQGRYVVSRSLVNDRMTSNQPHIAGVFFCKQKISSMDMASLRLDGNEHSWYIECEPVPLTQYATTSDQPILTLYKGAIESTILGTSIGAGLALSGDTVIQQGGGASATSKAKAKASSSSKRRR